MRHREAGVLSKSHWLWSPEQLSHVAKQPAVVRSSFLLLHARRLGVFLWHQVAVHDAQHLPPVAQRLQRPARLLQRQGQEVITADWQHTSMHCCVL